MTPEELVRTQVYDPDNGMMPPPADYVREDVQRSARWALVRVLIWLGSAAIFGFIIGRSLP